MPADKAIDEALEELKDISQNHCLMITEDEEDYRYLIELGLKQVGYSGPIVSTKNGLDLVDYLLRQNKHANDNDQDSPIPDIILLDMRMPKMDGRQTLMAIKSNETLMHIPVIIFTANQIPGQAEELKALGALDYVVKPDTHSELKHIFKSLLNHWLKVISD